MPESEIFKVVMQGGMLALWTLFGWWTLFRGVPILREMVHAINLSHQATVLNLAASNRESTKNLSDSHKEAVLVLSTDHKEAVDLLARECREERREMMEYVHAKLIPDVRQANGIKSLTP